MSSVLTGESPPFTVNKRFSWYFWCGIGLSLLFLFLAVRKTNWADFLTAISQADLFLLGIGAVVIAGTHFIFALRWRTLLAGAITLPLLTTFEFLMIGNLVNLVLSRLGDIARAMLTGRHHVRANSGLVLGSIVLERLLDIVMVLLLALGLSFVVNFPPIIRAAIGSLAVGLLIALGIVVALSSISVDRAASLLDHRLSFLPKTVRHRLLTTITQFASGLSTIRNGRQLGLAFVLSCLAWAASGTALTVNLAAFGLSVPWYSGLFVMMVVNLGGLIPTSPGSIGVYHYLAMLALSIWISDQSAALGYAVVTHGMFMLITVIFGSWSLFQRGISLRSVANTEHIHA